MDRLLLPACHERQVEVMIKYIDPGGNGGQRLAQIRAAELESGLV
jgi:hypothetical protein